MNVIYKFNNGNGATICNECRTIIATGKRVERFYCDKCQERINSMEAYYKIIDKEVHFNRENLNK